MITCVAGLTIGPRPIRRRLGVLGEHVEVAILIEHACVQQLVLELLSAAAAVGFDEVAVGIGRLRVLVEIPYVGVSKFDSSELTDAPKSAGLVALAERIELWPIDRLRP